MLRWKTCATNARYREHLRLPAHRQSRGRRPKAWRCAGRRRQFARGNTRLRPDHCLSSPSAGLTDNGHLNRPALGVGRTIVPSRSPGPRRVMASTRNRAQTTRSTCGLFGARSQRRPVLFRRKPGLPVGQSGTGACTPLSFRRELVAGRTRYREARRLGQQRGHSNPIRRRTPANRVSERSGSRIRSKKFSVSHGSWASMAALNHRNACSWSPRPV